MASRLTKKLQEAVRRLSYRTSVEELKDRGVQNVNVVGLDRIVGLIEAAVNRTLKNRMMGFGSTGETGEIASETREEFLRLLRSHQMLEREKEESEKINLSLQEQLDAYRRELHEAQQQLAERQRQVEKEVAVRGAADDQLLVEEVHRIFESASIPGDSANELLELVLGRLEGERERVAKARMKEHGNEVGNLERRIRKLSASLKDTESKLGHVLETKEIDPGISSIYRDVQGLDGNDALFEKKSELMKSIFIANLDLLSGAGGEAAGAPRSSSLEG